MSRKAAFVTGAVNVAAAGVLLAATAVHPSSMPSVGIGTCSPTSNSGACNPGGHDGPEQTAQRWKNQQINELSRGHRCINPDQFPKGKFPKSLIIHATTPGEGTTVEKRVPWDQGFKAAVNKKAWIDRACAK